MDNYGALSAELQSSTEKSVHSEPDNRARLLNVLEHERPEFKAGRFVRDCGDVQFYQRVDALLFPEATLLDFGAGRGRQFDLPDPGYLEKLQKFQGKVKKVIGTDVYDGVKHHPYLDEWHVAAPGAPLPVPSSSVDIVVADWVLEHIESPEQFAQEMERIVKPGGWVCARTLNKWSYVGVGATLIPEKLHETVVQKLIPNAKGEDIFKKYYRINTLSAVSRMFSASKWDNCSYLINPAPRYFANSAFLFKLTELYQKLAPYSLSTDMFIFLKRI